MEQKLDLIETATNAGKFTTFLKAVEAAGLTNTFKGEEQFTIFAPTDEAFARLSEITLNSLLKPENVERLKSVLTYHVLPGKMMSTDMGKKEDVPTVFGQTLKIESSNALRINNVSIQKPDIEATNGVIHIINSVLTPAKTVVAK
jgi:uncharacterized surface protein with fasciclin (FAS1) repeats